MPQYPADSNRHHRIITANERGGVSKAQWGSSFIMWIFSHRRLCGDEFPTIFVPTGTRRVYVPEKGGGVTCLNTLYIVSTTPHHTTLLTSVVGMVVLARPSRVFSTGTVEFSTLGGLSLGSCL